MLRVMASRDVREKNHPGASERTPRFCAIADRLTLCIMKHKHRQQNICGLKYDCVAAQRTHVVNCQPYSVLPSDGRHLGGGIDKR